jgi:RNA polymerase sigma factor (sigma-70 family)
MNQLDPSLDALGQTGVELASAQRGDGEAMNRIVNRYTPRLSSYLRQQVRSTGEDPENVAQEVWLRFYSALDRFELRRPGGFWLYLKTIARNYVAKQSKRNRPSNIDSVTELADSFHAPVDSLVSQEDLHRFERLLWSLRDRERQALLLRIEDEPYASIACQCGYPSEDAARVAVDRAMKRLRVQFGRGSEAH